MRSVLIAGVAGFIGSNLSKEFLRQGFKVIGLDNLSTGRISNIEPMLSNDAFRFINCDVCSPPQDLPEDVDFVFHLASPASPPKYMDLALETMAANSLGTRALLEYSERVGARFLYASTSEVYGDPLVHPQVEDYWGNVNPIGPRSVYDESKRFGETLVAEYQRQNRVDAIIVRIFNTFGPNMDPFDGRVVSNFIHQILVGEPLTIYGDGSQTRSFCFIDDLVRGLQAAIQSKETGPINLGNPGEFTLLQLVAEIEKVLDTKVRCEFRALPTDDPKRRRPDISRAKTLLDWEPRVSLQDGIRATHAWMREELSR